MNAPKPKQPARKPTLTRHPRVMGHAGKSLVGFAPEPNGPRTPYLVDDPHGPGSEPDYFPGKPAGGELPKM